MMVGLASLEICTAGWKFKAGLVLQYSVQNLKAGNLLAGNLGEVFFYTLIWNQYFFYILIMIQ